MLVAINLAQDDHGIAAVTVRVPGRSPLVRGRPPRCCSDSGRREILVSLELALDGQGPFGDGPRISAKALRPRRPGRCCAGHSHIRMLARRGPYAGWPGPARRRSGPCRMLLARDTPDRCCSGSRQPRSAARRRVLHRMARARWKSPEASASAPCRWKRTSDSVQGGGHAQVLFTVSSFMNCRACWKKSRALGRNADMVRWRGQPTVAGRQKHCQAGSEAAAKWRAAACHSSRASVVCPSCRGRRP